jgi:WD40 repeat protein
MNEQKPPPKTQVPLPPPPTEQRTGANPDGPSPPEYLYDVFISYRHVEPDRRWAKWLHSALETYRVPTKLRKQHTLPARLKRVFRDEDELPASPDLNKVIEKALHASRFLIVVCSPRTPESEWVNKEVVRFREMGRDDRILALLIEAEPGQSFPRALREIRRKLVDATGSARVAIEEIEPLAADVRSSRTDESPRFFKRMARLRLLACILGVPFDDLRQRDQERRMRRLIVTATAASIITIAFALLSVFAVLQREKAQHAGIVADKQTALAAQKEQLAAQKAKEAQLQDQLKRHEIYISNMKAAWNAWQRNALVELEAELDKYDPHKAPDDAELRGFEWYFVKMLPKAGCQTLNFGQSVHAVRFSPNGEHLAAVGVIGGSNCVKIWKLPGGQLEHTLQLGVRTGLNWGSGDEPSGWPTPKQPLGGRQGVAYSPDGRIVAGTCLTLQKDHRDGVVKVWDADTGREIFSAIDAGIGGHSVIFSPDGKYVIAGGYDRCALVWSAADGKLAWELSPRSSTDNIMEAQKAFRPNAYAGVHDQVASISFGPKGKAVTLAEAEHADQIKRRLGPRVVKAWPPNPDGTSRTIQDVSSLPSMDQLSWEARSVAYSPDAHWALAVDDGADRVRLLDISDRARRNVPERNRRARGPASVILPGGRIECVAICEWFLALAARSGQIDFRHIELNEDTTWPGVSLGGHEGSVTSMAFSSDTKKLAAAGASTVTIWSTQATPEELLLEESDRRHRRVSSQKGDGPQGPSIITIFDVDTGKPLVQFRTPFRAIKRTAASSDGRYCAVAASQSESKPSTEIQLYDLRAPSQPRILDHAGVTSLAFDRTSKYLASVAFREGTLRIWDAADGRELTGSHTSRYCGSAVFAGDDGWIVTSGHGSIVISRIGDSGTYFSINHQGGGAWACSADGLFLAACAKFGGGGGIDIWDLTKKVRVQTVVGTSEQVRDMAFTLDNKRLLTRTASGVIIWSLESGEDIFILPMRSSSGSQMSEFAARIDRLERDWRAKLDPPAQTPVDRVSRSPAAVVRKDTAADATPSPPPAGATHAVRAAAVVNKHDRAASGATNDGDGELNLSSAGIENRNDADRSTTPTSPSANPVFTQNEEIASVPGSPIDLLEKLDVKQSGTVGGWQLNAGQLVFPRVKFPSIAVYERAPAEYTLTAEILCKSHATGLVFGIVVDGAQGAVWVDNYGGSCSGLDMLNGMGLRENSMCKRGTFLKDGVPNQIEITVHSNSVHVLCNGEVLVNWTGTGSELSLAPLWADRHTARQLFVGMGNPSPYVMTKLTLTPLRAADTTTAQAAATENADDAKGWVPLLNGKDLKDWLYPQSPGRREFDDGVIRLVRTNDYLLTKRANFKNFKVRIELSASKGTEAFVVVHQQGSAESGTTITSRINDDGTGIRAGMSWINFGGPEHGMKRKLTPYDQFFTLELSMTNLDFWVSVDREVTSGVNYRRRLENGQGALGCIVRQGTLAIRKIEVKEDR